MCQPSLGRSGITVFACGHPAGGLYKKDRARGIDRGREDMDDFGCVVCCLFRTRSEISRDYPLNLSISLSGGKETNQDSPSNGE